MVDLTEIQSVLTEGVKKGYFEIVGHDEKGEPLYKLTDLGKKEAEKLIGKGHENDDTNKN